MNSYRAILLLVFLFLATSLSLSVRADSRLPPGKPAAGPPAKGMLLVARRGLTDRRFAKSVILVVQHGQQGTLGLIINRKSHLRLSHIRPEMKVEDRQVYYGGPVARRLIFFLLRRSTLQDQTERVVDDILVGVSREVMQGLLSSNTGNDKLRLYSGHAGWAVEQLENEIRRGDWYLLPADPDAVFSDNPGRLWQDLIETRDPAGILAQHASGLAAW